ncbi:hypothetical protein LTR15_010317 [Elasticomyces elasticus]|nr:hypothetical protein LTR15_010317 [Elasticomyces elasticus]
MSNIHVDLPLLGTGDVTRLFRFIETAEVEITLESIEYANLHGYIALSYTWEMPFGNPSLDIDYSDTLKNGRTILCNGKELAVTRNLYEALEVLRVSKEYGQKQFWVDAICIDQSNEGEKDLQVKFMAKIYQRAQVLVWLGGMDDHASSAIALIESLCALEPEQRHGITPTSISQRQYGEIVHDMRRWISLACFFLRRWFIRAWVVQEVLSSANDINILCGDQKLSWKDLVTISHYLSTGPWGHEFLKPEFTSIDGASSPNHQGPAKLRAGIDSRVVESHKLITLALIRSRRFECKYPKDKVFSVIGLEYLADPNLGAASALIKAEYKWSAHDVFTRTAIDLLRASTDLLVLYSAEGQDYKLLPGLPSWVPDWSVTDSVGLGVTGYERFSAAGSLPRHLNININAHDERHLGAALELKGFFLDRIGDIGETAKEVYDRQSCHEWLWIICSLGPVYRSYGTSEDTIDVFWRTVIKNTARDESQANGVRIPPPEFREYFTHWLARVTQPQIGWSEDSRRSILEHLQTLTGWGLQLPSDDAIDRAKVEHIAHLYHHNLCLRLFSTHEGLLGFGTTSLRPNDEVWIVAGSRVPLILRPARPGLGLIDGMAPMELVGACYLHGVMYGQAAPTSTSDLQKILLV